MCQVPGGNKKEQRAKERLPGTAVAIRRSPGYWGKACVPRATEEHAPHARSIPIATVAILLHRSSSTVTKMPHLPLGTARYLYQVPYSTQENTQENTHAHPSDNFPSCFFFSVRGTKVYHLSAKSVSFSE